MNSINNITSYFEKLDMKSIEDEIYYAVDMSVGRGDIFKADAQDDLQDNEYDMTSEEVDDLRHFDDEDLLDIRDRIIEERISEATDEKVQECLKRLLNSEGENEEPSKKNVFEGIDEISKKAILIQIKISPEYDTYRSRIISSVFEKIQSKFDREEFISSVKPEEGTRLESSLTVAEAAFE